MPPLHAKMVCFASLMLNEGATRDFLPLLFIIKINIFSYHKFPMNKPHFPVFRRNKSVLTTQIDSFESKGLIEIRFIIHYNNIFLSHGTVIINYERCQAIFCFFQSIAIHIKKRFLQCVSLDLIGDSFVLPSRLLKLSESQKTRIHMWEK